MIPKPKSQDEILDSILRAKMRGFRRVDNPAAAQEAQPESATPDSSALQSRASSLSRDTRLTGRAAEILKANLGAARPAGAESADAPAEATPEGDVVITSVRPEAEAFADEPKRPKAVVVQKSTKKILFRQG
jgi:hypothetical protein